MKMKTHELTFTGDWLERGFWLYVWEVTIPRRKAPLYYVGRTGDSSSLNAASPFNRMGQHLDLRLTASAAMLTKNLCENLEIKPKITLKKLTQCQFRLVAVGPILDEAPAKDRRRKNATDAEKDKHDRRRDLVAAMERDLANAMENAGYTVINDVHSRMETDKELWTKVRKEFAKSFQKLKTKPAPR